MIRIYFSVLLVLSTVIMQANDLNASFEYYCFESPGLYQEMSTIIHDAALTSEEKNTQLTMIQNAAHADLEEKIGECIDIYTDVASALEGHANYSATIDQIRGEAKVSVPQSANVFKRRLLEGLKRFDASTAIVFAFAVCAGSKRKDIPRLDVKALLISSTQFKLLVSAVAIVGFIIGSICSIGVFNAKQKKLRKDLMPEIS